MGPITILITSHYRNASDNNNLCKKREICPEIFKISTPDSPNPSRCTHTISPCIPGGGHSPWPDVPCLLLIHPPFFQHIPCRVELGAYRPPAVSPPWLCPAARNYTTLLSGRVVSVPCLPHVVHGLRGRAGRPASVDSIKPAVYEPDVDHRPEQR